MRLLRLLLLTLVSLILFGCGLWLHREQLASAQSQKAAQKTHAQSVTIPAANLSAEFPTDALNEPPPAPDTTPRIQIKTKAAQAFTASLSAARLELDPSRRQEHLLAALTEWASADVAAAGAWLFANATELPRDLALAALFDGAKAEPDAAADFARELSRKHPQHAADIGSNLIAALGRADEHVLATQFASAGDEKTSPAWLTAAYHQWGRQQPEEALSSALALTDTRQRQTAFHATVSGWAKVDPQTLAHQAVKFRSSDERTFALLTALRQWAVKDADAAASFLVENGPLPGAELILED